MKTRELDYDLPPVLIADHPSRIRRRCRLLRLERATGAVTHHRFDELPALLSPGDLLVANDTAVIPTRLLGERPGGGQSEIFLLEKAGPRRWRALVRPGAKLRPGAVVRFPFDHTDGLVAHIESILENGTRVVHFRGPGSFAEWLKRTGQVPLPPYIRRKPEPRDRRDYQTVFARRPGAVAAPTAGLHFDGVLLERLRRRGVRLTAVTLHVGAGTFRPITAERLEDHHLERERFRITAATRRRLRRQRDRQAGRVVAVGTTVTRALETMAASGGWETQPGSMDGYSGLFIRPGYRFRLVDALITNFHLPRSSLLALVCAFAAQSGGDGVAMVLAAYREAIRAGYRFYSYGDAMFIV